MAILNLEQEDMIHLDLNDDEKAILSETLLNYLSNLSYEIADTDLQDFRDKLKAKRAVLEKSISHWSRQNSSRRPEDPAIEP